MLWCICLSANNFAKQTCDIPNSTEKWTLRQAQESFALTWFEASQRTHSHTGFGKIFSFLFRWPFQHPFWVLGGPWGKWLCKLAAVCKRIVWRKCWSMLHMEASVNLKLWWGGDPSIEEIWVRNKIQSLPRRYFCLIVPSILCKRGPGGKRISEFGGPDREKKYINLQWNKTKVQVCQSLFA